MEDWNAKSEVLEKKLSKEKANLARLEKSLGLSQTNSQSMVSTLDKFKSGLRTIESCILPVYERTRDYQIRQDNMEKTLTSIDKAIGCYNVVKETESIIKCEHGPLSKDLNQYMTAMDRLTEAIDYFNTYHPGSPEYTTANVLYQKGKKAIEREFESLLTQYSRPLTPIQIADLLGENEEDEFAGTHQPITTNTYLPQSAREPLREMAVWLSINLTTSEFNTVYAKTRASVITKSLQGLIDHQKSASGESIVSAAPSIMFSTSGYQRSPRAKQHKHKLFSNKLLKKALIKGGDGQKKDEESFAVEMEGYVACVSALLKLIEFESELMLAIIPQKFQRRVFDMILQPALDLIVDDGEKLGSCAQRAASRYNFKEVPMLFPLVRHLRQVKPQFDLKLEGLQPVNRSKFAALITALDNIGNKILDLFVESIKNDPDKSSNMPIDGTVHELTRNTMFFMNTVKDHAEVAGAMLLALDPMYAEQKGESLLVKVANYMSKVLSALGINLTSKSKKYQDIYIAHIFMLNNYNYIYRNLHSQDLLALISRYEKDIEKFYQNLIEEQRQHYSQSLRRAELCITFENKPHSDTMSKLSDKEKQAIKDRFTGFNKEFEDTCKTQKTYAIPDAELRQKVIAANKKRLVDQYGRFREKYMKTNFTKNAEKYIKYTTHDVEEMLDKTFDAAS